jgi:hypothetical protein
LAGHAGDDLRYLVGICGGLGWAFAFQEAAQYPVSRGFICDTVTLDQQFFFH